MRIEGAKLRLDLVKDVCSPCEVKYASDFAEVLRDSVGEVSRSGPVQRGRTRVGETAARNGRPGELRISAERTSAIEEGWPGEELVLGLELPHL